MVSALPFRGLRYDQSSTGNLAAVLAPPYDVISPEERAELGRHSPLNIIHVELPSGDESRYQRASALLRRWRADGTLLREPAAAYYVLQEQFFLDGTAYCRVGVLAAVTVEPWSTGAVLPHEHTLPGPKLDRLRLLQATTTNVSPIFLMYDDPGGEMKGLLQQVMAAAPTLVVATLPGQIPQAATEHRLWVVTDVTLGARIAAALARTQAYIADGHHRYETALTYREEQRALHPDAPDGPWDAALMFLVAVDDPGLVVLPIHRIVKNVEPALIERLPTELSRYFDLTELGDLATLSAETANRQLNAAAAGSMLFASLSRGVVLAQPKGALADRLPGDRAPSWRVLDVSALHTLVMEPLLGLGQEQIDSEQFVRYSRDAAAALESVYRHEAQLAVLLRPTRPEQVCAVARDHERMPQKSTFYFPKPLTGLVLYPHEP